LREGEFAMAEMILRTTLTSPFGRKPRLAAAVLGLAGRLEVGIADMFDDNDSLRVQNPLGKMPTLVLADGSTLYDSRVILEYLDHLAGGGRIIPVEPAARFGALKLQALGDGVMDAGVLRRLERCSATSRCGRSAGSPTRPARSNAPRRAGRTPPSETDILVGEIAVACALGFLDFRFAGEDWRASRPRLAGWFERFGARCPGFADTAPR
jgi:Glutathione S-transferase